MPDNFNIVSVVGLGYVGLPTAAVIANRGITVIGVDTNPATVAAINDGETPFVEPDLDILVNSAVVSGNLKATDQPAPADVFVIAVPTPFKDDHVPDLSYLELATRNIAPVLDKGNLIILESTSPVGTTQQLSGWLAELRPDIKFPEDGADEADVYIAHSPERVLPGRVLIELVDNDRVIGGITPRCGARAAAFYGLFVNGECHLTNARTAELVKLAENAYRDTNIAFANEMSLVCDELGINVWEMIQLANRHPRVEILKPGPGVGGHCIAVDPWFIVDSAPDHTPLIRSSRAVNDGKPGFVTGKVLAAARQVSTKTIACLGLSYKADIDDLRESPAVEIVRSLSEQFDGQVLVAEPNVSALPEELQDCGNVTLADVKQCLHESDVILLLTDHREFKFLASEIGATKTIIDTRGTWVGK